MNNYPATFISVGSADSETMPFCLEQRLAVLKVSADEIQTDFRFRLRHDSVTHRTQKGHSCGHRPLVSNCLYLLFVTTKIVVLPRKCVAAQKRRSDSLWPRAFTTSAAGVTRLSQCVTEITHFLTNTYPLFCFRHDRT